jgi:DNA polymerase-3 subunit delta'
VNGAPPPGLERYGWPPPPRANAILCGHAGAEQALLAAAASGRLPHAWLLCGERGIGKATLAFRFARFLLAGGGGGQGDLALFSGGAAAEASPTVGDGLAMAPTHPVFRRVASGGHADLFTCERQMDEKRNRLRSEIVVEDVRQIPGFLSRTAAEGGWRVVVVDGVEEANRSAANALLKVLEEPPPRSVLLLVSHRPGILLPTIRSRCRRLLLRPLSAADVVKLLGIYRPDLEAAEAAALAQLGEGSIGAALALADGGGVEFHGEIQGLLANLPALDLVALDKLATRVAKGGAVDLFPIVAGRVCGWLARLIRAASTGRDDGSGPDRAAVERLARAASLDRWLEVWEKTRGLLARAESANLDRKQVIFELFFFLWSAARPGSG